MKNIKFISLTNLFRDNKISEPMVSLDNSLELLALSSQLGWRITLTIFGRQGKVSFRLRQIHNFFNYILRMNRKHGGKYTVSYLKFCQLAIQKAIAGNKLKSLREVEPSLSLPRLSSSGLPRYIPLSDRRAIMSGSISIIRFWLTLYSVYRIINIPGKIKLSTITDPFEGDRMILRKVSSELKALALNSKKMFDLKILCSNPGLLLFETASPTSRVSWTGVFTDPFKLHQNNLGETMELYMKELGYFKMLDIWEGIMSFKGLVLKTYTPLLDINKPGNQVGQLSRKQEAAGKVRVFAMVDIWTQSVMSPLHKMLSAFLGSLPNDGTKDQVSSWKRAAQKSLCGQSFGYDLSAATDRLPLSLQQDILSAIGMGDELARLWAKLLTSREYYLKHTDEEKASLGTPGTYLRYAVGQPMGALSSFNMLAVTHHYIVQLAYLRSLPNYQKYGIHIFDSNGEYQWFDNYEITGDDLVLFDKSVADQYLLIMKDIGVPINESKSVIAKIPAVEYLKVTTLRTKNVSALSWKMFISNNSFMGRINNVYSLIDRDYIASNGIINWLKDTTCTKIGKGNINLVLFAVLCKYYYSGKISLQVLFESLLNKDNCFKSLKSNLIKGVNQNYMSNLVSLLVKNKTDLRIRKIVNAEADLHWIGEYLRHSLKDATNPRKDSEDLADHIVEMLFPGTIPGEDIDGNIISKPTHSKMETVPFAAMKVCFSNILNQEVLLPILLRLDRSKPIEVDVNNLFEYTESLERYHEVTSLWDRVVLKIKKDKQIVKPKFTMNLIKLSIKANSWTPTYKQSFVQKETTLDPSWGFGDMIFTEIIPVKVVDRR